MKKFLTLLASAAVLAMPLAVVSTPVAAQTGGAVTPAAPAAAPTAAPADKAAPAASKTTAKAKKAKKSKRVSKVKAAPKAA